MTKQKIRIALIGSFTQDLFPRFISKKLELLGFESTFFVGKDNQYAQDILNPKSGLYNFQPDAVIFSVDLKDLEPNLFAEPLDYKLEEKQKKLDQSLNRFKQLINNLIESLPKIIIFITNFVINPIRPTGLLEYNSEYSLAEVVSFCNRKLSSIKAAFSNIFIINIKDLVLRYGFSKLFDTKYDYLAKTRYGRFGLESVAEVYSRYLNACFGKQKKCIVLDADGVLWGGLVGENGLDHIVLSNEGTGKAFYDFQKGLQNLYKRGILLAICSKNNYEDVMEVFKKHPFMVLQKNHFSSIKIKWEEKAKLILEISNELNIGTDSLVFLDDSAFEREIVKSRLPEIEVPTLPKDPSIFRDFLLDLPYFDTLLLTKEDRNRNIMYKQSRKRKILKKKFENLQEFLRSLNMVAHIREADTFSIPRISQLTRSTNQLNLTTRPYSKAEIKNFVLSSDWRVFLVELEDKLGEYGIVGLSIVKLDKQKSKAFIDTFLLSCRVLGRNLETAFLSEILRRLNKEGIKLITGEFIPTKKNEPAKQFIKKIGLLISESSINQNFKISKKIENLKFITLK